MEHQSNPIFTVADGLIWLTQDTYQGSMVSQARDQENARRGGAPGQHTVRITDEGLRAFPRAILECGPRRGGSPLRAAP